MVTQPRPLAWNFETPDVNNLLAPIQQGVRDYRAAEQRQVENNRAERGLAIQEGQFGLQQKKFESDREAQEVQRIGNMAKVIDEQKDPNQRAAMLQRLYAGSPAMRDALSRYGVDPNDHMAVPKFLMAQAGQYDPLAEAQKRAAINASNASAALSSANAANVGKTDPIREYEFARRNGFTGSFEAYKKQAVNTNASQNITWGQDAQGNYVPMQANRAGELMASRLPPGVVPVPTEVMAYRKAAATEQGQGVGKAVVDLPAVESNFDLMDKALKGVEGLKDTDLNTMTGWVNSKLPNVSPKANEIQARIDQIQGKAFLQAFNGLRGGGAITEKEGEKATDAISRLSKLAVGTKAYREALADVRAELTALRDIARRKAQPGGPAPNVRGPASNAPIDLGNGITIRRID